MCSSTKASLYVHKTYIKNAKKLTWTSKPQTISRWETILPDTNSKEETTWGACHVCKKETMKKKKKVAWV
jgi:hypothetical protein